MKPRRTNKQASPVTASAATTPPSAFPWRTIVLAAAALLAAFVAYGPALDGPFLLDDLYLPFGRPHAGHYTSEVWLAQRPVLGLTFWANYLLSGTNTFPFHAVNLILHFCVTVLVFVIAKLGLRQFAPAEQRRDVLAAIAAGVFLLHPIHTEAVAYIASRSDVLSTFFCYAAIAVFLWKRQTTLAIASIAAILVLFGLGLLSKEQAAALPAAFLLIDLFAPDGKRNWRLHLPIFTAGLLGVAYVFYKLTRSGSAGFKTEGIAWYEYFFTECRAFWHYMRLTVLPAGQNVDPDFPISRSLMDHLAIVGLGALFATIAFALWKRRTAPLATAGLLILVALLAPTSSFIPIQDVVAERRMYFPFIGLLFILVDVLRRWRVPARSLTFAGAAVLLVLAGLTYSRASAWGSEMALWEDSVRKSPNKWRPRFQYAYALFEANRCDEANREFAIAAPLAKPDSRLLLDWGLSLDCAGKPHEAIEKIRQATLLENTAHAQATIGMLHGKQGQAEEALKALDEAQRINPQFAMTYVYRGNVFASQNRWKEALPEYEKAVRFEPDNAVALQALALARRHAGPGQ